MLGNPSELSILATSGSLLLLLSHIFEKQLKNPFIYIILDLFYYINLKLYSVLILLLYTEVELGFAEAEPNKKTSSPSHNDLVSL